MRLPDDFPHTRHEQYLVALPDRLLAPDERLVVDALFRRMQAFRRARFRRQLTALLPANPSDEDVVIALAAVMGPLVIEERS